MKPFRAGNPLRFLLLLLPVVFNALTGPPYARAGLTVDIHIYRGEWGHIVYSWLSTNAVGAPPPVGDYLIRSPQYPTNGSHMRYTHGAGGFSFSGGGGSASDSFTDFMGSLTNGLWSIQITNATSTNLYTFTVSASGLSSNLLHYVTITYPTDNQLDVPPNPTFTWSGGPIGWLGTLDVDVYDEAFTYYDYASLPVTETNWTSSGPLVVGTNTLWVGYRSNATDTVVASTPVDDSMNPMPGWVSTANIEITDTVEFVVAEPSGAIDLLAHYRFDNPAFLGEDSSTNGFDLNVSNGWNGGGVSSSSDALAGAGAAEFVTDGGNGGGFLSYDPTPPAILAALAGDFSISVWVKTTQSVGAEWDPAQSGAGVIAADVDGPDYDLIPLALTGGQAAFHTGGSGDWTLNSFAAVNDGNYRHIVVTRHQASGEKRIYVDGALDVTDWDNGELLDAPALVTVGALMDASVSDPLLAGPYNGFEGLLDDLQIYGRVLTSNQVAFLFAHPGQAVSAPTNEPVEVELQLSITRAQDVHSGDVYTCFPRLNSVSPAAVTEHRVESPNGYFNGTESGSGSVVLSSLAALISECTNGLWRLYINKDDPAERVFTFSVTIAGLDTNLLQKAVVLSPTNGSVGVPVNPAFTWSGPVGFNGVFSQTYRPAPPHNSISTNQPGAATSWPSPPVLSAGTNRFYISFYSNNVPNVVNFTTPVDGDSLPLASWSTTIHLNSDATSEFVVSSLPAAIQITNALKVGGNFQLQFLSQAGTTNLVQWRTNVATGTWQDRTNILGDGTLKTVLLPIGPWRSEFFRVLTQ